jgi:hypothetical protein
VRESIRADFPDRSDTEVDEFCFQANRARHNLNKAVGGPLLRRRQAYRNVQHVLAIRDDELIAHLPIADNASRRKDENTLVGMAKMHGKLYLEDAFGKDWISHRYLWLGYAALGEQMRSQLEGTPLPSGATDLDVMIALGAMTHDLRQPVSVYPWEPEHSWKAGLASIGLLPEEGYDEPKTPFGADTAEVWQTHWTMGTNEEMQQVIFGKTGAEEAIDHAVRQLQQSA